MTTSIYQNPFSYEKLGPHFKEYLQLCRKHINDEKGRNTSRHHINPKFLTVDYIEDRWNWVHLEHEDHREAHRLLHLIFPENTKAISSYNRLKGEISPNEIMKKRYEDPLERKKTSESIKKWHDEVGFSEEYRLKKSEAATGEKNPNFGKKLKRVICEHCGEDVAVTHYAQRHGDKCKKNPQNNL